jgi:hypothetical protein
MTVEEFTADHDECIGICKACGHTQYGAEPDAENYKCEECGKREVYVLDQALLEGWLTLE